MTESEAWVAIGSRSMPTAIAIRLLDPRIDRLGTRLELLRQFPDAFSSPMKGNNLIPETRRVRVPCTWYLNTFPL